LIASKAIKILRDQQPTSLYYGLIENCYMKQIKEGLTFFLNCAKEKEGLQTCFSIMKEITIPWWMNNLNNDKIKIEMKKVFLNLMPLFDK